MTDLINHAIEVNEITVLLDQEPLPAVQSIERRFLRASGVVTVSNISSRIIALVLGIVSARLLTEAEFGALGLVQSTLTMFGAVAGLALSMAATRYVALYRSTAPERVRSVILFVLSVGSVSIMTTMVGLWAGAPWLVQRFLQGNITMIAPLRWAAVQLAATAAFGIVSGVLVGRERFAVIGFTTVVQNIAILLASVVLIPLFRLPGAIGAQAIGLTTAVLVSLWWLRDVLTSVNVREVTGAVRREARVLAEFCLPTLLANAVLLPCTWAATVLVVNQPSGYLELAYFSAADRFRLLLNFVAGFVGTALLPILAGTTGRDAVKDSRRTMEMAFMGVGLMVLPLTTLFAFGGPQFMAAFGRSYQANWSVMLPVIAWGATGAIGSIVGTALIAHGRQWLLFAQQSTYGITVLTVTFVLRGIGGGALAIGHLTAVLLLIAWSLPAIRRTGILSDRAVGQMLGSTGFVCGVCVASWLCPPAWRLIAVVPVTLLSVGVAALLLTASERRRLAGVFTSAAAFSRAVRGVA